MKINKMFKTTMCTLLAVGMVVSGIPCGPVGVNTTGIITVQAAVTSSNSLVVDSPLTARQQREITFNACFYANRYSDLKSVYGYDAAALYQHFLNWGIKEGRCASPVFDAAYYLEANPDLKSAFGNDYVEAYRHWLQYGYLEERESSHYYNSAYYRQCYADLAGLNNYELMHHYLNYAAQEERIANTYGLLLDGGLMKAYYPAYAGTSASIVTALESLGIDSGKSNLTKIASANGIENYSGTLNQKKRLLDLLKQGLLVDPKATEDSVQFEKGLSLDVVDMKQYDLAWKNINLGESSKKIGSKGCTVTCLAMTESYRTGKRITPKDMVEQKLVNFKNSGDLIWPKNYSVYSGKDYLAKIVELLSEGKPVMICSKNDYTDKRKAQHWVVVTGYNGEGLSAENFTINDPGSPTRKTLKAFLDFYYYYKDGCTYRYLRYYNN